MIAVRLAALAICALSTGTILQAAEAVDAELHRQLYAGWAALESIDDSLSAIDVSSDRTRQVAPDKKAEVHSGVYRYRKALDSAKISLEAETFDDCVRNSRYIFVVSRKDISDSWSMRFVELDVSSPSTKKLESATFHPRVVFPNSVILLGPASTIQHLKPSLLRGDPKFVITKLKKLSDGLVNVVFKYDLIEGELDCDPVESFVTKRGRTRFAPPGITHDLTYSKHVGAVGPGGKNLVDRIEYEVVTSMGYKQKDVSSYSYPYLRKSGELDEEKFRLTAYGLPEPEGIVWEKPRRWLPYWLAGAGSLIILVATLVIRRARRTRSPEKQP